MGGGKGGVGSGESPIFSSMVVVIDTTFPHLSVMDTCVVPRCPHSGDLAYTELQLPAGTPGGTGIGAAMSGRERLARRSAAYRLDVRPCSSHASGRSGLGVQPRGQPAAGAKRAHDSSLCRSESGASMKSRSPRYCLAPPPQRLTHRATAPRRRRARARRRGRGAPGCGRPTRCSAHR